MKVLHCALGRLGLALVWFALVACRGSAPTTGPACGVRSFRSDITITYVDNLDVLFVIDDAPSMVTKQAMVHDQLEHLMALLVKLATKRFPNIPGTRGSRALFTWA
jgi:hypothetical protein